MGASIQLLLGSCMYNFLPAENSVSPELLENLNVVHRKLRQSKDGAISFDFKMKLENPSFKGSVLGKIMKYATALDCKDREYNEVEELLWVIIYKVFQQNRIFCPFEKLIYRSA